MISCQDEAPSVACMDVICENGGSQIETETACTCDCPLGFTGENCQFFDQIQIQTLLDEGQSPMDLINAGWPLEALYGSSYQGGLLFFLDTSNGTGLVAAASDQGEFIEWGCMEMDLPDLNNVINNFEPETEETEVGARIGDGSINTDKILAAMCTNSQSNDRIAAQLCRDLGDDWFLPSRGELNLMFFHLKYRGLGDFENGWYWSSSEFDKFHVWVQDFADGTQDQDARVNATYVRAAKAF